MRSIGMVRYNGIEYAMRSDKLTRRVYDATGCITRTSKILSNEEVAVVKEGIDYGSLGAWVAADKVFFGTDFAEGRG